MQSGWRCRDPAICKAPTKQPVSGTRCAATSGSTTSVRDTAVGGSTSSGAAVSPTSSTCTAPPVLPRQRRCLQRSASSAAPRSPSSCTTTAAGDSTWIRPLPGAPNDAIYPAGTVCAHVQRHHASGSGPARCCTSAAAGRAGRPGTSSMRSLGGTRDALTRPRFAPDLRAPGHCTTRAAAMTGVSASSGMPATAPGRRRVRWGRVLAPLVSLVIVGGVFFYFLPQFASISDVWASIRSMTWLETTTLVLVALWNLATYWFVMVSTMPGLTIPQAAVVTESSTAVANTVPAGGAVGIAMSYGMYASWGFSRSRSSVSLLVAGVWNNFVKLAMPVLALALLAFSGGGASGGRIIAGSLGIAGLVAAITVFALLLRSRNMARRIGLMAGRVGSALIKPLRRPAVQGWELATMKFRDRTLLLLRARWLLITVTTLISHLSLFLVLLLALRHVGVSEQEVSWVEALAVFAFARLLSAVPLTPGGLGVVEVALITGLSAAGGARAQVAAGVLIFRALTYVLPIPVGLATYVFWRRNRSWRRPPNGAPRTSLVPEST